MKRIRSKEMIVEFSKGSVEVEASSNLNVISWTSGDFNCFSSNSQHGGVRLILVRMDVMASKGFLV